MAYCVVSEIYDTDHNRLKPACMVHTHDAPCPRDGQPANPNPVHIDDSASRVEALAMWQQRTGRQRPLVLHHGSLGDDNPRHEITRGKTCWCVPDRFEARS